MKDNKSSNTKIVFIMALILELFMAFPVLAWFTGTILSVGSLYVVVFIINTIALIVVSSSHRGSVVPPIIGIVGSFLGFVPVIGWLIHTTAAMLYLVSVIRLSRDHQDSGVNDKQETKEKKEIKNSNKKIRDAEIVK